ncbi:MAG: chemotaxis protein CheW [Desulfobulbaceae bacterium]|nr:chemotaxis protein CheW [Desulfobulbaceae bacterium]
MLLLLFTLQDEAYAIDSTRVVEVIPFLLTQKIPMTPKFIIGMANYRGKPIPVLDLGLLLNDQPCRQQLNTRIILISISLDNQFKKIVGLLAENVTDTVRTPKGWQPKQAGQSPMFLDSTITRQPMVRWFQPEQILPDEIPGLSFMEQ